METVLYADVLFLIDFSMDYLSLYAASRLLSLRTSLWRMIAAASLGALYGVLSVLLQADGLFGAFFTVLVSLLLTVVSFGVSGGWRGIARAAVTVWGCGALLGGITTAFSSLLGASAVEGGADLLCAGALAAVTLVRFARRRLARGTAEITVSYGSGVWQGNALIDSGNLLVDPIGGYAVILLRRAEAYTLLGTLTDTLYKGQIAEGGSGVRVVPMRTADGTRLMYGFLSKDVRIRNGTRTYVRTAVVCVDHGATEGGYGGCAALLPASLVL